MNGESHLDDMVFGRRYRVTEKVGAGGMAEVYKAVDETLGRTVAVKVLRSSFAQDPAFVERFRREAQAAANLQHPGIVNIYDWGADGDAYYIVMEYIRGTDLKSLVRTQGPLAPAQVAEFGEQICAALAVAHGYDVIHRDIKPQNIVLMPDGRVRVMDFGIARMTDGDDLTQTGSVLGTAQYVSPEQAQGRPLTAASDLYSLGIVLYELLTGSPPFAGETPVAVALKQVHDAPAPLRQLRPDLSPALEAVIMRALVKDPRGRYATADEMRQDLRRAAQGEAPAAAPTPGIGDTTVMPEVRATPAAGTPQVRRAPEPPRRRAAWPWIVAVVLLLGVGIAAAAALGLLGPRTVQVRDLTGMTLEEATTSLAGDGLAIGDVVQEYSQEPTGTVFAQDPKAGDRVEKGTTITVTVSKGIEMVDVPAVKGMSETEGYNTLRAAGFELQPIKRVYDAKVAEGVCVGTEPTAGASLPSGSQVTLVVSKGIETKAVPSVTGKTSSEAKKTLEDAGFKVKVTEDYSDTVGKGKVVSQDPDTGVVLQVGQTVTIVVSKGKNETTVPDTEGKTETEARDLIEAAGLQVAIVPSDAVEPSDVDHVVHQDPPGGSKVPYDTVVTITVAREPAGP